MHHGSDHHRCPLMNRISLFDYSRHLKVASWTQFFNLHRKTYLLVYKSLKLSHRMGILHVGNWKPSPLSPSLWKITSPSHFPHFTKLANGKNISAKGIKQNYTNESAATTKPLFFPNFAADVLILTVSVSAVNWLQSNLFLRERVAVLWQAREPFLSRSIVPFLGYTSIRALWYTNEN